MIKFDCDRNCEECSFRVLEDVGVKFRDVEVWCTKYNVQVGNSVDDLDYEGNPIQRIVYWEIGEVYDEE
jgi:prolyl-tRNA synthetase